MIVQPLWMAPPGVQAATTRRHGGGQSRPPFDDFNLAMHVDDDPVAVAANRQRLEHHLGLAQPIAWPQQVHGIEVVDAVGARGCQADAVYSESPGQVCAVLTADCLPVLLARRDGGAVAAVHAGWRGLADGVIEAAEAHGDQFLFGVQWHPERILEQSRPAQCLFQAFVEASAAWEPRMVTESVAD